MSPLSIRSKAVLRALAEGENSNDFLTTTDLLFDPWLTSSGPKLSSIAALVTEAVLDAGSKAAGKRIRQPRADAVERTAMIVSSIIANLKVLHANHRWGQYLALPMKHAALTRYDRPGFRQLSQVVEAMEGAGLIMVHPARAHIRRTGIAAVSWLRADLMQPDVPVADVGRAEGEELIRLSARVGRDQQGNKLPSILVDYRDNAETIRLRAEMDEINAFLTTQRIEVNGEPQAGFRLTRRFLLRSQSSPIAFNLHGRLYGAYWLSMPKELRDGLTINGEHIADLDFASMFPRLAYARVGAEPPQDDLYAIPGLEGYRAGVKAGFAAMLSSSNEMTRLPSGVKDALPAGWTGRKLAEAIGTKHPALVPLFGQDIAMDLMFTESRILVAALRLLIARGTPALPMHDGIMVACSKSTQAEQAMMEASQEVIGIHLPVAVKTVALT